MNKVRLLFKKEGRAKYISHLDLMHTVQRTFLRAGVKIRHTEGFNPHPYMSFILPLSVGCESKCELMDFDLDDSFDIKDVPAMLNSAAPEGVIALEVFPRVRKGAELKWLEISGNLKYDVGVPEGTCDKLNELFKSESVLVTKRTKKKGETTIDLIPNMKRASFELKDENTVSLNAVISAQDPSINPDSIVAAIKSYLPDNAPDFAQFVREEVFDQSMTVFR